MPFYWLRLRCFVVMARFIDGRITGWIESKIEGWMGLEINREKTRVVNLREEGAALDFLGCTFRFDREQFGRERRYLNLCPSKKSLAREREALREKTSPRMCFKPLAKMIEGLNRHLTGWANYFSIGHSRPAMREINHFVRERLIPNSRDAVLNRLSRFSRKERKPRQAISFLVSWFPRAALRLLWAKLFCSFRANSENRITGNWYQPSSGAYQFFARPVSHWRTGFWFLPEPGRLASKRQGRVAWGGACLLYTNFIPHTVIPTCLASLAGGK